MVGGGGRGEGGEGEGWSGSLFGCRSCWISTFRGLTVSEAIQVRVFMYIPLSLTAALSSSMRLTVTVGALRNLGFGVIHFLLKIPKS